MLKASPLVLAIALATAVALPASAAERSGQGFRNSDLVEVSAARKYHKRMDQSLSRQHRVNEPYAGYRTDIAGNSYFYYRPGGTFGPGRALPPPYPR